MSYDIGEATKELEDEAELHLHHSSLSSPSVTSPMSPGEPHMIKFSLTAVAENT